MAPGRLYAFLDILPKPSSKSTFEPLALAEVTHSEINPVIAGTRITVDLVLEKLAPGKSVEQILSEHGRLT